MGSVVVSPGVGVSVCGYPVRTGCGHACGGQDLQTHFFYKSPRADCVRHRSGLCAVRHNRHTPQTTPTHTHTHTQTHTHTVTHTHVYTHTHTHTHCVHKPQNPQEVVSTPHKQLTCIDMYISLSYTCLRTATHTNISFYIFNNQEPTYIMHTSAHKRDRNH